MPDRIHKDTNQMSLHNWVQKVLGNTTRITTHRINVHDSGYGDNPKHLLLKAESLSKGMKPLFWESGSDPCQCKHPVLCVGLHFKQLHPDEAANQPGLLDGSDLAPAGQAESFPCGCPSVLLSGIHDLASCWALMNRSRPSHGCSQVQKGHQRFCMGSLALRGNLSAGIPILPIPTMHHLGWFPPSFARWYRDWLWIHHNTALKVN